MPASNRRQFSTKSIKILAEDINSQFQSSNVETFLQTLSQIDKEIQQDIDNIKAELAEARIETKDAQNALARQTALREHLQVSLQSHVSEISDLKRRISELEQSGKTSPSKPVPSVSSVKTASAQCGCRPSGESQSSQFFSGVHEPDCRLRKAMLSDTPPEHLVDLLIAREDAYRNQKILVDRLKLDNGELKATYDTLWTRYQQIYSREAPKGNAADDKIEHLSMRVHQAGQAACVVASKLEERLKLTARDVNTFRQSMSHLADGHTAQGERVISRRHRISRAQAPHRVPSCVTAVTDEYENDTTIESEGYESSGQDNLDGDEIEIPPGEVDRLLKTLDLQQKAHEMLRGTVDELTRELKRMDPQQMGAAKKCREQLQVTEEKLTKVETRLRKKELEVTELKKQLKKVVAEYDAVSVAHSYSNAELSKIRANNRAKTKVDRLINDRPHGIGNSSESRPHHRKIHFR